MGITSETLNKTARPLQHKGYTWNWDEWHKWEDRHTPRTPELGLITKKTKVFAMGSCFADNVVRYLSKELGIHASSFGESRFYDPISILQTLKHLLVEPQYGREDLWVTSENLYANPFRNPRFRAKSWEELQSWTDLIETDATRKLKEADLIVMTLGGTETWRHPHTGKTYITIPFPDVFNSQMPKIAEFHNLTFEECFSALEEIYLLLRRQRPHAHILFTLSPVRMTFTTSDKDILTATSQSKSTLRAAVGELTDRYKDHLHYFQSYEIVTYAPPGVNFYMADNIHVSDQAVTVVMQQFARQFIDAELRQSSGYELLSTMLQNPDEIARLQNVERLDYRYLVIKGLRSLGLEKWALKVYRQMKNRKK